MYTQQVSCAVANWNWRILVSECIVGVQVVTSMQWIMGAAGPLINMHTVWFIIFTGTLNIANMQNFIVAKISSDISVTVVVDVFCYYINIKHRDAS